MTNHVRAVVGSALLFVLAAGASGMAQTPDPPQGTLPPRGGGARPGGPPNLNQAQMLVQEQWNVVVLRRAKVALGLTDQQNPLFIDKMTQLQNLRDRHELVRHRAINELGRLTRPNAYPPTDDATLLAKVKDFGDMDALHAQQEAVAVQAVDAILTPFQRARFRVFEENMEVQKLQMLAKVR